MKKRVISFLIALMLIVCSIPAYAAQAGNEAPSAGPEIQPRLLTNISVSLSKSGSQLKLYTSVICNNTDERIYLTVYLQRYRNGSWQNYSSYTAQGTGDCLIAKYVSPPRGYSYRIYAVVSNSSLATKYSSSVYF
ncbi:hypothetical protein CE91St36_19700 [Christensenellaceae bacterium]|uniref:hypothetical protein n=1 Tax=Christensenella timonensis TaxID=1816678 RepID=UPI000837849E|nr:hypothetical protein [Christensenella timonensis]BDF59153.1 hypothetical protein CE91St36_19700 [Christensenellaceae bacterium]BDF61819.1 hypothetical protein CE91St37_19690 [Christensenellaceae bacterium]